MNEYNSGQDFLMSNSERVLLGYKKLIVRVTQCCPPEKNHERYRGQLFYLVGRVANYENRGLYYHCLSREDELDPGSVSLYFNAIEILP